MTVCKLMKTFLLIAIFLLTGSQLTARNKLPEKGSNTNQGMASAVRLWCLSTHRAGKMKLTVSNIGMLGDGIFVDQNGLSTVLDCPEFQDTTTSAEFPAGSKSQHIFVGSFWIGSASAGDTLVSVGIDGWSDGFELQPDTLPLGVLLHDSIVSDNDITGIYSDTLTDQAFVFDTTHVPMNIEVVQNSHAWSSPWAEDFVLFDYQIKNIGGSPLVDVYMGIYIDGDVGHEAVCQFQSCHTDDLSGFVRSDSLIVGNCSIDDTLNLAWLADNDGDPQSGLFGSRSVQHVTGVTLLDIPVDNSMVSFNWWVSDTLAEYDFGPREKSGVGQWNEPFRDFGTGGLGTPEGDRNKYYLLRNREIDYDQAFTSTVPSGDPLWMLPDAAVAESVSIGYDTRYLLSFGPFSIAPGETVPISFAYVGGENFHTQTDNFTNNMETVYDPDAFYGNLDFSDLITNARWARWVYDTPGFDTDGDGYAGKLIDNCGRYFSEGDGVPDYLDVPPPSPPVIRFVATPSDSTSITIRWNGMFSETNPDPFTQIVDFEGYRVYLAVGTDPSGFGEVASYDVEDYYKYINVLIPGQESEWKIFDIPFTLDSLVCLYGSSCADTGFHPLDYTAEGPYWNGVDSFFYFDAVDNNAYEFGVTSAVSKVYPAQPFPSSLDPALADSSELTGEGLFKYFEYEYIFDTLMPALSYCMKVSAFDFGYPMYDVSAAENSREKGFLCATTTSETGVDDEFGPVLPDDLTLEQNYPNPFNAATLISYALSTRAQVSLRIYNINGRLVRTLIESESRSAGSYTIVWDGRNETGNVVASGLYFYRLTAGEQITSRKMVLLK